MLKRFNVPERLWSLPPATFSGGEQQRINLARGLLPEHPILLLDEPTASLDANNRAVVVDIVRERKAQGRGDCCYCPRRERARRNRRCRRRRYSFRHGGLDYDGTGPMIIENARIVLADEVIEKGYVVVDNGLIVEIGEGFAPERGEDIGGDLLLPGLVELHTDHIEAHIQPRPKVHWDAVSAVVSYDAQIATSGITTVLDSLRVWREEGNAEGALTARPPCCPAPSTARRAAGLLRIDHFLHLRCEVPMPKVVDDTAELINRPDVRLVSLMDHTPGQRQFQDPQKLREYYRGKSGGMSEAELDECSRAVFRMPRNTPSTTTRAWSNSPACASTPLASHDDTTAEHVEQAIKDRVAIAEFPPMSAPPPRFTPAASR